MKRTEFLKQFDKDAQNISEQSVREAVADAIKNIEREKIL